jgi:hypothetical protein
MLFQFGINVISWMNRKQTSVALSTAKAEYIAASIASREAVWLRKFLAGHHPRHDAEGSSEAPVHIHR